MTDLDLAQLSALAHEQGHFNGTWKHLTQPAQVDDPVQIQARLTELQERRGHEH